MTSAEITTKIESMLEPKKYNFNSKIEIDRDNLNKGLYFIHGKICDEVYKLYYIGQSGYRNKEASIYARISNYVPSKEYEPFINCLNTIKTTDTLKEFYNTIVKTKWFIRILSMPQASASEIDDLEKFCIQNFAPIFNVQHSVQPFHERILKILNNNK